MVTHALAFCMLLFCEISGSFITLILEPAEDEGSCLNACLIQHFFLYTQNDFVN